jgi:putative ABC transport system permease protein
VRALDRKLLRDLWHIRGQALAIALVMASGLAMFVMYLSTFDSLRLTQRSYYQDQRFAHVFAAVKRAPRSLEARIAELPGVAQAATRVVADVTIDVPGLTEPAVGRLISIPERGPIALNALYLRRGRLPEPGSDEEAVVSEAFALAHGLGPGSRVGAVINGRRRELAIVGVALSPEYVYSIRPGEIIPDDERFGVFWMRQKALAAAFDMEGGFNDVALRLAPGALEADVIARLDALLERYGGRGAIPRAQQISHWYLDNELAQLQNVGLVLPIVFLAVAAFLLSVVLTRIVAVQREQIAALKALGYSDREVGLHYAAWSLAIALAGAVLGTALGAWMGSGMTNLYNDWFRFPELQYRLDPGLVLAAVAISVGAGLLGSSAAVRRAVALPPAEAMRPEPPASYRESRLERIGLRRLLSQSGRMVVRNLQRRPLRTVLSVVGIAFAVAILIVGTFFLDSMDELMAIQFSVVQRHDVMVGFVEPRSAAAFHEVTRLPGVLAAEPLRAAPVRLSAGARSRQLSILGLSAEQRLLRVIDADVEPVTLPPEGLVLSRSLAEILDVGPGDEVTVEVLEGARPERRVRVAALVEEYMGTSAYMEAGALHRLLREGPNLSGATLMVDPAAVDELYRRLKALPAVAAVSIKVAALEGFEETLAETMDVMIFFNVLFACTIACGVVYNAARISLSERARELASLRVIGFTRAEISSILLGELAALTLAALPVGLALGYAFARALVRAFETELYRFPLIITPRTYAWAVIVVLVAAALSGLIVRRKLDRLDLVAVLKTRE